MRIKALKAIFILVTFLSVNAVANAQVLYDSSYAIQITDSLLAGHSEGKVLQIALVLKGNASDSAKIQDISFSTKGTGNRSDILRASCHYLDSNTSTTQALEKNTLLQEILFPKANNVFSDSIYLKPGTHYFILAYDIDYGVAVNDSFDAEFTSIRVNEISYTPTVTAPIGNRKVSVFGGGVYCKNTRSFTGSYEIGPTKVSIGKGFTRHSDNSDFYYLNNKVISVKQGQPLKVEIESGPYYDETHHVWIDWDGDGYFEKEEKELSTTTILAGNSSNFTVTVPCGTRYPGLRRIRIIGEFYSSNIGNSCAAVNYGSVEDYLILILPETAPRASFIPDTTAFEGGVVSLKNSTETNAYNMNYEWDLDDDGVYDTSGFDMQFKAGTSSSQTVVLKAEMISCDNSRRFFSTYKATLKLRAISAAPVAEFIANTNYVAPNGIVKFNDLTVNGATNWKWSVVPARVKGKNVIEFLNGTHENSPNPEIRFKQKGKYAVLLEVSNSKGSDQIAKLSYVTVENDYELCNSQTNGDTLISAFGVITDNGGAGGKYSNSIDCSVLIKPTCAKEVHLDLNSIDISKWVEIGNSGDFLRVYDGSSVADSALHYTLGFRNGIFTRGNSPASMGRLTAKSGSMLLRFISDGAINADGFKVQYSITPKKVNKPQAQIIGIDTTFINTPEYFSAGNKANWIEKIWDFDGDGLPESFGNEVLRRFPKFGTYNVSVVLNACGNTDTATKKVVVLAPSQAPIADFETPYTTISPTDTIRLFDKSEFGPTDFRWCINRVSATHFVNETSSRTRNPYLVFDSLGFYTIGLWVKNGMGEDSLYKTRYIRVRDYCTPSVVSDAGKLGITKVLVTSLTSDTLIHNVTKRKAGYSNYSGRKNFTASPGERFIIRVERKDTTYAMQRMVWLDSDLDGEFSSSEFVAYEPSGKTRIWQDTFMIDTGSNYGLSRLRIGVNMAGRTNYGCGPHLSGEFEDYGCFIVRDKTAPIIQLKGADTIGIEMCGVFSEPGYLAFDNVDGNVTAKIDTTGKVNSRFPGLYAVVYKVADVAGNMASTIRWVAVGLDSTAPEVSLSGNAVDSITVFTSYNDSGFVANDFCAGIDSTNTTTNLDTSKTGIYKMTYRAYDYVGNVDSIERIVVVFDNTPPNVSFSMNSDTVLVEVGTVYIDSGLVISDNYDTTFNVQMIGDVFTNKLDTFQIRYEVFDLSGNGPSTATRIVYVVDRTAPKIELPFDSLKVEVGRRINLPEPWVNDNYDREPDLSINGSFDKDIVGVYEFAYSAKDQSGNLSDTVRFYVHVIDNIKPSIYLNGAPFLTHCRWETFVDSGATVSDNYYDEDDVDLTIRFLNANDVEVSALELSQSNGYYTILYSAIDESGNTAETYRTILVQECDPNSIDKAEDYALSLYPNPVLKGQQLRVFTSNAYSSIIIYNVSGKQVSKCKYSANGYYRVKLPTGIYFLMLDDKSATRAKLTVLE